MSANSKILLIGPRLNESATNLGGATRSFEDMVGYFEDKGILIEILDSQKYRNLRVMLFPFKFLLKLRQCDVVFFNASMNGIKYLAPIIYLLARIIGRKIVIRPFGDSLRQSMSANALFKFLLSITVLKADILYIQTLEQMNDLINLAKNIKQLKTSRQQLTPMQDHPTRFRKHFVFIGHVKETKGIDQILSSIHSLDDSYNIEIYGPILESKYTFLKDKDFYKGLLHNQNEVSSVLEKTDVLLMPTFYKGEGYPGIIIEAYSHGKPVIATRWKSIPEIVKHEKTGLLIEVKSADALENAIKAIDESNYSKMSKEAISSFLNNFRSEIVLNEVLEDLNSLRANQLSNG